MEKKLWAMLLVLLLSISILASCNLNHNTGDGGENNDPSNPGGDDAETVGTIFSPENTSTTIIRPEDKSFPLNVSTISEMIYDLTGQFIIINSEKSPESDNEIVIGNTSRDISKKALEKLNKAVAKTVREHEDEGKSTKHVVGYAIYATGNSLSLVWSNDEVVSVAEEYFINNYLTASTLILEDGFFDAKVFSLIDYYEELEEQRRQEAYDKIAEVHGDQVVKALQNYLAMFDDRFYIWLADLYDPGLYDENGNPLGGGFYAANSGRDTEGFAPDIETTRQALSFIKSSGALEGGSFNELTPEKMKNEILAMVLAYQSPVDGYFYHPQWANASTRRLARDLTSATQLLEWFNTKPYWNTPNNYEGQHGEPPGYEPVSKFTSPLGTSSVSAVSKLIPTASNKKWNGAAHLKTVEDFEKYVSSFASNIGVKSYTIGSDFSSQATQIRTRDKLAIDNKELPDNNGDGIADGGYIEIVQKYFDSWQLDNGLWEECSVEAGDVYYDAVNGLMKICSTYNSLHIPLKHYEEAFKAAAFMISYLGADDNWFDSKGTQPSGCVDFYNPWVSIQYIFRNLEMQGKNDEIERLRGFITADAFNLIGVTIKKCAKLQIDDGSFGYSWGGGSGLHQGVPVKVKSVIEGDVNGAGICYTGTFNAILSVLDIEGLSPLGRGDLIKFFDRIEELQPVIKDPVEIYISETVTFDDDVEGTSESSYVTTRMNAGYVQILKDNRTNNGNVLMMDSDPGGTCYLILDTGYNPDANKLVLEWEMCFEEIATSYTTAFQIKLSDAYMLTLGLTADGKITVGDASATSGVMLKTTSNVLLDAYEWNKFRIEHYIIDIDTRETATKVYINDALLFVSNNFTNKHDPEATPLSTYTTASFMALKATDFRVLFDNIYANPEKGTYVKESIDTPDKLRDFEGLEENTLPNGVTTEGGEIVSAPREDNESNNALLICDKKDSAAFESIVLDASVNCFVASMDMFINAVPGKVGKICVSPSDTNYALLVYEIEVYTENGETLARLKKLASDGSVKETYSGLPVGSWFKLTIEYYPNHYEASESSIVYLGDEILGYGEGYYSINGLTRGYDKLEILLTSAAELMIDNVVATKIEKPFVNSSGETVEEPNVSFPTGGNSSNVPATNEHTGIFDFESSELGTPAVEGLKTTVNSAEYGNNLDIVKDPKNEVNKVLMFKTEKTNGTSNVALFTASNKSPAYANCFVFEFDVLVDHATSYYQIGMIGDMSGEEVTIFNSAIRITSTSIEMISKTAETDAKAKDTETIFKASLSGWTNVRIEFYPEQKLLQIYVGGKFVVETDLYYSIDSVRANLKAGRVYVVKSTESLVYLDNVIVRAEKKDYVKQDPPVVTPPEEGGDEEPETPTYGNSSNTAAGDGHDGVFDFEGVALGTPSVEGLKTSVNKTAGNFIDIVADPESAANQVLGFKTVAVTGTSTQMYLTASKLSPENARCYVMEFDILVESCTKSVQFGLLGTLDGSEVTLFNSNVYFTVKNGVGTMRFASKTYATDNDLESVKDIITLDISGWTTVRLELYADEGLIKFYVNGDYKGESEECYRDEYNAATLKSARIYSTKSTVANIYFDDFTVSAIEKSYELTRPAYGSSSNVAAGKDHDGKFDFDDSTVGTPNIAGLKTAVNQSAGNFIDIARDVEDKTNKVLMIETVAISGTSNSATFTAAQNPPENANCYVFETDIYLDYSKNNFQLILHGTKDGSTVSMLILTTTLKKSDECDTLTFSSKTSATDGGEEDVETIMTAPISGWTSVRLELYRDKGAVKIYFNGTLACETDKVYNPDYLDATLKDGMIYALKNNASRIYVDNVTVEAIEKAY